MIRVYKFFGGTSRFYALVFTITGTVLAFEGKLTSVYVALIATLQTLIVAHSAKEDYHERAMKNSGDSNADNSTSIQ